jgi:hypothetical protein
MQMVKDILHGALAVYVGLYISKKLGLTTL